MITLIKSMVNIKINFNKLKVRYLHEYKNLKKRFSGEYDRLKYLDFLSLWGQNLMFFKIMEMNVKYLELM